MDSAALNLVAPKEVMGPLSPDKNRDMNPPPPGSDRPIFIPISPFVSLAEEGRGIIET